MPQSTTLRIFLGVVLRFRLGQAWQDRSSECPWPPSLCLKRASQKGRAHACTSWVVSSFGVDCVGFHVCMQARRVRAKFGRPIVHQTEDNGQKLFISSKIAPKKEAVRGDV